MGKTTIDHPWLGIVYTTYLRWFEGWFIIYCFTHIKGCVLFGLFVFCDHCSHCSHARASQHLFLRRFLRIECEFGPKSVASLACRSLCCAIWSVDLCLDLGIKKHQEPGSSRTAQEPHLYDTITSSTAQGSGGSFKDRKPIGEVGGCESRIAERIHWWTERWLELCFFEVGAMVAVVTSPTTAGCSVV